MCTFSLSSLVFAFCDTRCLSGLYGRFSYIVAGAAFQHVLTGLTASTVTYVLYDQAEHCPIRLRAWVGAGLIARLLIGGGPRDRTRLRR